MERDCLQLRTKERRLDLQEVTEISVSRISGNKSSLLPCGYMKVSENDVILAGAKTINKFTPHLAEWAV